MTKTINTLLLLIYLVKNLASQLKSDDNCNKYVEQILIDQGFKVACQQNKVITADCSNEDFQNIVLIIQNQKQFGGIKFINVNNLHFSSIFLEDLYVENGQKGILIQQGVNITIQNITINSANNPLNQYNKYNRKYQLETPLIYFQASSLAVKNLDIIQLINLKMPLFQMCTLIQQPQSTQVIIDSAIIHKFVQDKIPASLFSQTIQGQLFPIFDLRCQGEILFEQKIQFKNIELFAYQAYDALLVNSQSFNQIEIDQLIFHQNQYGDAINIWDSQGILFFDGSSFENSELIINNIDFHQINFISSQYGIFYIEKFKKIAISNTTLSSSQNLQSSKGSLFTIQQSLEINIFNLSAIIYPSCQLYSLYGGLIYMNISQQVNISNFYFNQNELFNDEVQHIGIQGGLIFTNQIVKTNFQNMIAHGAFSSSAEGAFGYIMSQTLELKNVMITKFISQKSGGAFLINGETTLQDVKLIGNKSYFTGGALYVNELIKAQNVLIENNESLFGGGIYFSFSKSNLQDIIFKDNVGLIKGNDYSLQISEIKLMQFSEFNGQLNPPYQIKNYSFYETKQNYYQTDFIYNSLTYFVTMKFRMLGEQEWIENINNDYIIKNGYNDLSSVLYCDQQLDKQTTKIEQNTFRINNFFYSFSAQKEGRSNQFQGICSILSSQYDNLYFAISSQINDNCSDGMIQQTVQNIPYCQYCIDSVVFSTQTNKIPKKCMPCSKEYFDSCEANYSLLKQGFWRQSLTVDSSELFACSINKFNCLGGNYTGTIYFQLQILQFKITKQKIECNIQK
ncbi:hypothetical protein ABPG74_007797 [Tetrahymena malaccensis]